MTKVPMEMEDFEKKTTGDDGFLMNTKTIILKQMRIMYVMISIICFSCYIVMVDMLNTFIKKL